MTTDYRTKITQVGNHTKITQSHEGWPASGYKRQTVQLHARRVIPSVEGGERVQIELEITNIYENTTRITHASLYLDAYQAHELITALSEVRD